MHGLYLSPPVLIGSPGQKLAVTVVNDGTVAHTFTIKSQGIDLVLTPGKRKTAAVAFPGPGRTAWICRYHLAAGMAGVLVTAG
jgi:plastocyanin